jgi:hypothetical protein
MCDGEITVTEEGDKSICDGEITVTEEGETSICDGEITVTECPDAVNEMKLNKFLG